MIEFFVHCDFTTCILISSHTLILRNVSVVLHTNLNETWYNMYVYPPKHVYVVEKFRIINQISRDICFILVIRLYSENNYLIFLKNLLDANPSGCVYSSHSFFSQVYCLWFYIKFSGFTLTWVLCIVDWYGTICIFLNGNIQ